MTPSTPTRRWLFGVALVALAMDAGLYPAMRAARLAPTEALRA